MTAPQEVIASRKVRTIAEIGRGGMAEVILAVSEGPAGFKKLIVLKRAKAELSGDDDFLEMFLDEARLAARLNHPNVVQTYEVGEDKGRYFIAMEYLDGQPLHRIRNRIGTRWFPLGMQIRILIDALAGLHHAHELADFDGTPLGVVHRDATPQNVFVTYDGQIKVVDFGIAKVTGSSAETEVGILKGKVAYMAPEQARGERVDRRADIFAVGVMLWEAIAGERMWRGTDDLSIIGRLAQGRIPSLCAAAPNVDADLARICEKALAPSPKARHATALALGHELERWLDRQGEEIPARAVGRFVAAHFSEERAQMRTLIEGALRAEAPATPPRRPPPPAPPRRPPPRPPPPRIERDPTLVTRLDVEPVAPIADAPETLRHSSVSLDMVPADRPAPSRPWRIATVGGALVVAGALGVVGWSLREGPPPDAVNALAAQPAEVGITVHVWPATATIFVDGELVSRGPYQGTLPRDGRTHSVRAEAPSFAPKERRVTADGAMLVELSLDPAPLVRPAVPE